MRPYQTPNCVLYTDMALMLIQCFCFLYGFLTANLSTRHTFCREMQSAGHSERWMKSSSLQRSVSHRYGSFYLFFFLLPFTAAFLKFSPYNRALYTIKPSLTPPPQPLLVSDLQTQVICHQRGVLGETASPTLDFHTGAVRSWCSCAEFLNIVRNESGTETWMEKWCQSVYTCASVCLVYIAWLCFISEQKG